MAKNMLMGFLFSYVGLFLILMVYCALGALLFGALEGGDMDEWLEGRYNSSKLIEVKRKQLITYMREMKKREYIDIADVDRHRNTSTTIWMDLDGLSLYNARLAVKEQVDMYHLEIARAINKYAYDGSQEKATSHWSFTSAMLFTTSIVTLIGYGHISPSSDFGFLMTIVFALGGVPLMLMFIANIGDAMQSIIRLLLKYVMCGICRAKRKKTHGVVGLNYYPTPKGPKPSREEVLTEAGEGGDILEDQFQNSEKDPEVVDLTAEDLECPDPSDPTSELAPEHVPIPLFCIFLILIAYNFLGALMFHFTEDWSLLTSNYFCFVSLMTIGFGDYWPGMGALGSFAGKLHLCVGSVYIVLGLGVLGMGVNVIMLQMILKARAIGRMTGVVESKDADGDGMDDGDEEALRALNLVS